MSLYQWGKSTDGHCWDYCPHTFSLEDRVPVNFMYEYIIFEWIAETSLNGLEIIQIYLWLSYLYLFDINWLIGPSN